MYTPLSQNVEARSVPTGGKPLTRARALAVMAAGLVSTMGPVIKSRENRRQNWRNAEFHALDGG